MCCRLASAAACLLLPAAQATHLRPCSPVSHYHTLMHHFVFAVFPPRRSPLAFQHLLHNPLEMYRRTCKAAYESQRHHVCASDAAPRSALQAAAALQESVERQPSLSAAVMRTGSSKTLQRGGSLHHTKPPNIEPRPASPPPPPPPPPISRFRGNALPKRLMDMLGCLKRAVHVHSWELFGSVGRSAEKAEGQDDDDFQSVGSQGTEGEHHQLGSDYGSDGNPWAQDVWLHLAEPDWKLSFVRVRKRRGCMASRPWRAHTGTSVLFQG